MMLYWQALAAGIIQGLTEFLPVSSSGHLLLFHYFFNFNLGDDITFDAVLHVGTLVALLSFFWTDAVRYLKAFFASLRSWQIKTDSDQRLAWFLFLGSIPGGLAGYFGETWIDMHIRSPLVVAWLLIIVGVLLYYADRHAAQRKSLVGVTAQDTAIIGCAQALALVPGVSRSGITIIAGLSRGLQRATAARFSFLLSMPIIAAAGAKKILDLLQQPVQGIVAGPLVVGFIASAVVGYFCLKYFLRFIERASLRPFVYYRVGLGLLILSLIWLGY